MAKAKPILMNGEMVRATLDKRKTQTRRLVKKQPFRHNEIELEKRGGVYQMVEYRRSAGLWEAVNIQTAPYQPGDVLWVRETFAVDTEKARILGNGEPHEPEVLKYRADGSQLRDSVWTPSIHMPKWACRLFLRVTNVRVERINDISDHDITCEGVRKNGDYWSVVGEFKGHTRYASWDCVCSASGLLSPYNPWVFVYEFQKCEKPEGWEAV